jgi:recombination protein RecA
MGEREERLNKIVAEIQQEVGEESFRAGILEGGVSNCEAISTRCLSLDVALGVGGVPKGRVVEIFGPESSGKTTLGLTIVAECQKSGGTAAYIDTENAIDPLYTQKIGVDLDKLLFSQPDCAEDAFRICEKLVRSELVGVIVIDSVAALVPKVELEGDIEDHNIAAQARLISKSLRKLSRIVSKSKTCLIFINQIREKVGMMMPGASRETTPGGRALRFYASVRMDIRRTGTVWEGSKQNREALANETLVKVIKNKVAPPFKNAKFNIVFGEGIQSTASIIDIAVKHKMIDKSGSWYSLEGTRLGQGMQPACKFLEENEDILMKLEGELREKLLPKPTMEDKPEADLEDMEEEEE